MNTKPSFDSVINLWQALSEEEQREVIENPQAVKRTATGLVRRRLKATFVEHLDDKDVPERFQAFVPTYRKFLSEMGYTGPAVRRVRCGFTAKRHAPLAGPCYQKFQYLQNWNFPDEPTKDCLVFGAPWLVPGSAAKTAAEQLQLLGEIRTRLGLPAHHMSRFESVALNAAIILAEFKRSGKRVPLDRLWVRTDTCYAGGYRLSLGNFGERGLYCDDWNFDEKRSGFLGVFALGVEGLGR